MIIQLQPHVRILRIIRVVDHSGINKNIMKSVPTSAFSSSTKTTKKLKMMYSSSEDESSDEEPQLTQSIHMETGSSLFTARDSSRRYAQAI